MNAVEDVNVDLGRVLESIRSSPNPQSEEDTTTQLVLPVLISLGWRPYPAREILPEFSVEGRYVDIALNSSNGLVALIEVKAPPPRRRDLYIHAYQVFKYAFKTHVAMCVLTNGWEWLFYLAKDGVNPDTRRFATLRVREDSVGSLVGNFGRFLSKDSLVGGSSEAIAANIVNEKRRAYIQDVDPDYCKAERAPLVAKSIANAKRKRNSTNRDRFMNVLRQLYKHHLDEFDRLCELKDKDGFPIVADNDWSLFRSNSEVPSVLQLEVNNKDTGFYAFVGDSRIDNIQRRIQLCLGVFGYSASELNTDLQI